MCVHVLHLHIFKTYQNLKICDKRPKMATLNVPIYYSSNHSIYMCVRLYIYVLHTYVFFKLDRNSKFEKKDQKWQSLLSLSTIYRATICTYTIIHIIPIHMYICIYISKFFFAKSNDNSAMNAR